MTEPTPVTVSPALLRGLVSRRTLLQGVGGVALTAGLAACGSRLGSWRNNVEQYGHMASLASPISMKMWGWSNGGFSPTHMNSLAPISITGTPGVLWK